MNEAEKILLIILGSVLAIFLILAIVLTVKIIEIVQHVKRIIEKAEDIADKAEAVGDFFKKTAGPIAVGRLFTNIAESMFKRKSNK